MSRTKNVKRNIIWGIVNKIVLIILPFISRTIIIQKLGTDYLGLSSLFISILGVLNLSELGFGTALVFSMYEPIAKGDSKSVNALLAFYNKSYKIIGATILIVGLVILPFLPNFISGEPPADINIYILYIIYLINTVVSYMMFAYKKSLFYATQRYDVDTNINTLINLLQNVFQIAILLLFTNYYVFVAVMPLCTIVNNIWISHLSKKMYPQFYCSGSLEKKDIEDIVKKTKGLILQKIGNVILFSVDNIVISYFLGLHILAIYNNYYYVVSALMSVLTIVISSMKASVGNSIVTESMEKNYNDFKKLNFIYVWILGWMSITLMNLYQPFITLWVGEKLKLSAIIVILFVIYFFANKWNDILFLYQEAVGLWHENRFVPLIAAIVNLVVNIYLVQKIGLSGILISTIVCLTFIYSLGYAWVLFKYYFKDIRGMFVYFGTQFKYIFIFVVIGFLTTLICKAVPYSGLMLLLIRGIICVLMPNIAAIIIFRNNKYFQESIVLVKNVIK